MGTPYTPPGKDPTGSPLPPKPKPVPAVTTQEAPITQPAEDSDDLEEKASDYVKSHGWPV